MKTILLLTIIALTWLTACKKQYVPIEKESAIEKTIDINVIIDSDDTTIKDFGFDSQNNMWVATDKGMVMISGFDSEVYPYPNNDSYSILINSLSIDLEDNIWLTSSAGILLMPNNNSQFTLYNSENGMIPSNNTSKIFCDSESCKYFVHQYGVSKFENGVWLEDERFPELSNFEDIDSISFNNRKSIIIEKDDYFLISTFNGIFKYKNDTTFEMLNYSSSNNEIYAHAIYLYNTNTIWLQEGTPAIFSVINDTWSQFLYKGNLTVTGDFIVSINYSENGSEIQFFRNGEWTNLSNQYFNKLSSFYKIRSDKFGHLWFSNNNMIYKIKPDFFL